MIGISPSNKKKLSPYLTIKGLSGNILVARAMDNPTNSTYLKHFEDSLKEEHPSTAPLVRLGLCGLLPVRVGLTADREATNARNGHWMMQFVFILDDEEDNKDQRLEILQAIKFASTFCQTFKYDLSHKCHF